MAVLLFLERGLESGGAQVRRAVRAAAAPGERAPGIWLCPNLELHFAQPRAASSEPSGFLLDEHGLGHSAWELLLCWAALGCAEHSGSGVSRVLLTIPTLTPNISCGMGRVGTAPLIPDWHGGMIAWKNTECLPSTQLIVDSLKLEKTSKVIKCN